MKHNLKVLIVDDEALACDMLEYLLRNNVPEVTEIKKISSAAEAIHILKSYQPHILFLDIQMPFMNGFEMLSQLDRHNFSVIFTTAFNKYSVQAIRISALDYLLKPIDPEELKNAVIRHIELETEKKYYKELYDNFTQNLSLGESLQSKIALRTMNGIKLVLPKEIVHCDAINNYTKFYFTDNSTLVISKTIKDFEEILSGYHFIRIHKSHLVNIGHIVSVSFDSHLQMSNGTTLEISRRKKEEVMKIVKSRIV